MGLNRTELADRVSRACAELLREKGYISFVDVLLRMEKLNRADYESWRLRRVPYLEKVITANLSRISHMLRAFQAHARRAGLRPSRTAYLSWGKGTKTALRFSKTGDPNVEAAYATHFLPPRERQDAAHRPASSAEPAAEHHP